MGYLKGLYHFINKLNKKSTPYVISDEVITLEAGKWEGFLNHDNVLEKTIEIYTQPNKQGNKVLNYTIELKDETWKTFIRVFHSANTLYITYETLGDTVEAEDINNIQYCIDTLDVELEETTSTLNKHVSNSEIHITKAEREAWNDKVERVELELTNELLKDHKNNKMNPHGVTKEQLQLERVDNVQQASKEEFILHRDNNSNPHNVTKDQVGLSNVDNIKQASKVDFDNHVSDTILHITTSERNSWNDKYTKSEVDNKLAALETKIDWKESVNTFDDIATTYPSPIDGWTVNVKDTDYTYRYSGSEWVVISANAIPKATTSVDGLLSKEDKAILDDVNTKKHTHSNKSIIDTITSALISNWNSAFTHISDTVKHITSDERTLWNTITNKVDKETGKGLSSNDFTSTYKSKLDGITANATKTEASTINGNIKINGTETTVYTHPTGSNPHGTTKADVGLGNVDNTSDLNKPISTAVQTALNGKANLSHTHDYLPLSETWKNEPKQIPSGDDLDTYYTSGIYSSFSDGNSNTILNRPPEALGFVLYVNEIYFSGVAGRQIQMAIIRNSNNVYIRSKGENAAWTSWTKVYSANNKPTLSEIGAAAATHTHDERYYTESEIDTKLNNKANSSHTHSQYVTKDDLGEAGYGDMMKSVYDANGDGVVDVAASVAWTGVTGKPSTFTPSSHTHDDRYYTETEVNSLLGAKANSSHTHTKSQITDFPTSLPANGGNADTVDGKHASSFAPSGFGLGGSCTSVTDWNSALNTGYYMGYNVTNAPDTGWWMGYVMRHNDLWVVQIVNNFSSTRQWKQRFKVNGTWTSWEQFGSGYLPTGGITWNDLKGV